VKTTSFVVGVLLVGCATEAPNESVDPSGLEDPSQRVELLDNGLELAWAPHGGASSITAVPRSGGEFFEIVAGVGDPSNDLPDDVQAIFVADRYLTVRWRPDGVGDFACEATDAQLAVMYSKHIFSGTIDGEFGDPVAPEASCTVTVTRFDDARLGIVEGTFSGVVVPLPDREEVGVAPAMIGYPVSGTFRVVRDL